MTTTSPRNRPHFVVLGDINGWDAYHVGDEAMLAANVDGLRRRVASDVRITALSTDPSWSAKHHGVDTVPRIGFAHASDREVLLARFLAAVKQGELNTAIPGAPVLEALASADGVLISGGGNLNSTWPEHLYERIALLEAAALLDVPAVVLGQTLGPHLQDAHRDRLAHALRHAHFVGVRELPSFCFGIDLGVSATRLHYQLDDAFFLSPQEPASATVAALPDGEWIAVTLTALSVDPRRIATELTRVAEVTDAPLVFIPHAACDGDRELSRLLASRIPAATHLLDMLPCRQVVEVTRRSALVVSNRYHPLVFALAHRVPCLAIYEDDYTRIKLRGALTHAGLQAWALDAALAWSGDLTDAVKELWEERREVTAYLTTHRSAWELTFERHWELIRSTVTSTAPQLAASDATIPHRPQSLPLPSGPWTLRQETFLRRSESTAQHVRNLVLQRATAVDYAESLLTTLSAREAEIDSLRAALNDRESNGAGAPEAEASSFGDSSGEFTLSVVIPTRDTRDLTLACLDSLVRGGVADIDVVVVDDGSQDDTTAEIGQRHPAVSVFRNDEPAGFTASANRGLAAATGEILLLLNSDTEVRPGALRALISAFEDHPRLGVAGAQLYDSDGTPQWSGSDYPTLLWLFAEGSGAARLLARLPGYRQVHPLDYRGKLHPVAWVTGAAMAVRRRTWKACGPLDERFHMYAQDIDLCARAAEADWIVAVLPEVGVLHHQGATIRLHSETSERRQNVSWLWRDLVHWACKWRGHRWARRAATALCLGARLRLVAHRTLGRLCHGEKRRAIRREVKTISEAVAAVREAVAWPLPDDNGHSR